MFFSSFSTNRKRPIIALSVTNAFKSVFTSLPPVKILAVLYALVKGVQYLVNCTLSIAAFTFGENAETNLLVVLSLK